MKRPHCMSHGGLAIVLLAKLAFGMDPAPPLGLHPQHLYQGTGRPAPIEVHAPPGTEVIDLVLMDDSGLVLAAPRSTSAARFDLNEIMPAAEAVARERERACFLQMLVDEEPVGSALVIEPLLSRMVPVTEMTLRPGTDHAYTRIVGWESEVEPPEETTAGEPEPALRICSGLRLYPERDVVLRTGHGDLVVALRPDEAPNTAWSFRHLAGGGFYRGVSFHRIVPLTRDGDPFVIQGGDPSGTGEGGPGAWLPLEPSGLPHDFGVISMARADDPDSAGSQFFICLSRAGTARLDGQYCAFGHVVAGAETIVAIAAVELADVARGRPVDPPLILEAELVPSPPRRPGRGRPDARVEPPSPDAAPRPHRVPR